MKKFQLNKQKLNLNKLTTPLIALSLMAGCFGLLGTNVSAASVTTTVPLIPLTAADPGSDFMVDYGGGLYFRAFCP